MRRSDVFENPAGFHFHLIVTLSPEAHHKMLASMRIIALDGIYWPTPDATATQGSREQMLDACREVRDKLTIRIKELLGRGPVGGV